MRKGPAGAPRLPKLVIPGGGIRAPVPQTSLTPLPVEVGPTGKFFRLAICPHETPSCSCDFITSVYFQRAGKTIVLANGRSFNSESLSNNTLSSLEPQPHQYNR